MAEQTFRPPKFSDRRAGAKPAALQVRWRSTMRACVQRDASAAPHALRNAAHRRRPHCRWTRQTPRREAGTCHRSTKVCPCRRRLLHGRRSAAHIDLSPARHPLPVLISHSSPRFLCASSSRAGVGVRSRVILCALCSCRQAQKNVAAAGPVREMRKIGTWPRACSLEACARAYGSVCSRAWAHNPHAQPHRHNATRILPPHSLLPPNPLASSASTSSALPLHCVFSPSRPPPRPVPSQRTRRPTREGTRQIPARSHPHRQGIAAASEWSLCDVGAVRHAAPAH